MNSCDQPPYGRAVGASLPFDPSPDAPQGRDGSTSRPPALRRAAAAALLLLLPLAAAAAADPATNAPAAEPMLVFGVLPDGVHDWHDIAERTVEPVYRRALSAHDRPPALEGWTGGWSSGPRGAVLRLVGERGPATNASAALAALRALVAEAAPGFPDGVAPEAELRHEPVERDADGARRESSEVLDRVLADLRRRAEAEPENADARPRTLEPIVSTERERPGVAVAVPSDLPAAELAAALERPMLAAAAHALAAALPDRAEPVRVAFHSVRRERSGYGPGGFLLAGPLRVAEVASAETALAAAFAPDAFPMPKGCGPARVGPNAVRVADRTGAPMPPTHIEFGPFLAIEAERSLAWEPAGAGLSPGRHLALAVPCDLKHGAAPAFCRDAPVSSRADFAETVLAPLERLAARAGWGAPGARPVRAFHPELGGAVLLPLGPDADADAVLADARARVAVVAEAFPDSVGTPFADVREVPAPGAAPPPAPGAAPGAPAAVRLLLDAAAADRRRVVAFPWRYGLWDADRMAYEEARDDALAAVPPGLDAILVPLWGDLYAAHGLLDPDAFGPGFLDAFARFSAALSTNAALRAALGADAGQRLAVRFRPLDADALAALRVLALDELARPGRAFLAVAGFESFGRDSANIGRSVAILPAAVGDDGEVRRLRAPAFATSRLLDPGIPGCSNAIAHVETFPTVRDPATDALAAAVLRVAETGDTNALAALVHPACRDALPPDWLAFHARLWSELAALGPLEVSFVPAAAIPGGIGAPERFDVFNPDAGSLVPLASRIPGLWLRGKIRVRRGGVPFDAATFNAILSDGAARLVASPEPADPADAATLQNFRRSAFDAISRRLDGSSAGPFADFERPLRLAAERADPPRDVTFGYSVSGPGWPPALRRHLGLPPASPDDAPAWLRGRAATRLERIARSGLATELAAAAAADLPVVDLAPGETLRLLPATGPDGVTREATARFLVDPDRPGEPALEIGISRRERNGNGSGPGRSRIPLAAAGVPAGARRFVAAPGGYRPHPRLAVVWIAADAAAPAFVYGALPAGSDADCADLLRRFVEDPEGVAAAEDPAALRPFVLRLRPAPEAGDGAAPPDAAVPPAPPAPFDDLRAARRRDAAALFAPPARPERPESAATRPLGENRRLRVALAVSVEADGPTNALPVVLRATASIETRPAPGAEWTPEPGAAVVEKRGVYRVEPDGTLALRGDFHGALRPWEAPERFHAAAGPLGVVLETALPVAIAVETADFDHPVALSATAVLAASGDLPADFADAPELNGHAHTIVRRSVNAAAEDVSASSEGDGFAAIATLYRTPPAIRLVRPEP